MIWLRTVLVFSIWFYRIEVYINFIDMNNPQLVMDNDMKIMYSTSTLKLDR